MRDYYFNKYFETSKIFPLTKPEKLLDKLAKKKLLIPGKCPICGNFTLFCKWNSNLRETGFCIFCRSSNRNRQLGILLLRSLKLFTGINFPSINNFSKNADKHKNTLLKIHNTESTGSIHKYLSQFVGYSCSEYLDPSYQSGQIIDNIIHQDLMNMSIESESLDILLSSDVFEHIPDPYQAFKEVYRVLKPGGKHIFTVPFYQDQYFDEIRASILKNGQIKYLMPPSYHSDPLRKDGILVYTIFALEMILKLRKIGYEVSMYNLRNPYFGILDNNAIIFETTKPT